MAYHFKNLVFEGGGVLGIAYVGAMEVLTEKGILQNISRVGGTSAGAINAMLLGLKYSLAETKDILSKLDFKNFLDDSWGIIKDSKRLINEYGWYKGDFFRGWVADLIAAKVGNPDATFESLKAHGGFADLYFIGTNLSTGFAEVFSYEHTPRMCVADAIRISMSIPLFFAAKRSLRGDVYVDGGVLDNYPIKLFDREKYVQAYAVNTEYYEKHNAILKDQGKLVSPYIFNQETLGFRLDSAKEIAYFRDHAEPELNKINNFFNFAWCLVNSFMQYQNSVHLHSDDWQRTIYIDTLGVGFTDFGISETQKQALINSGQTFTAKYFEWYDNPSSTPANRP